MVVSGSGVSCSHGRFACRPSRKFARTDGTSCKRIMQVLFRGLGQVQVQRAGIGR